MTGFNFYFQYRTNKVSIHHIVNGYDGCYLKGSFSENITDFL